MKKLFLFIFLMTISLGQSQTFPLDFSEAADLLPGVDGVTTSIVDDNGGPVMRIVGASGTWDNCQKILAQDVNLSDNNNNTITFRFKSIGASTSGQHLIKFEGGSGGAAVAEGFFNATGTEWQTITIDFGAGLGKYSKLVIFTDSGANSNGWNNSATGIYLIDDIAGGTNVVPPVVLAPSVAAAVPTARNAWDVVSLYTDGTYADRSGTNFNPGWGQSTVQSTLTLNGNNMLKYSNLNYQGIQLAGNTNISSMTTLHVDIYSPDATALDFRIISGGEFNKTLTLTSGQWNSFDIPLSDYVGANLAILNQLKFQTNPFGALRNTVYLDNIYFYRPATAAAPPTFGAFTVPAKLVGDAAFDLTAPTSTGSGAFTFTSSNAAVATVSGSTVTIVGSGSSTITATQAASGGFAAGSVSAQLVVTFAPPTVAAPTPTKAAEDVISIFSNAYTDRVGTAFAPNWGQNPSYSVVQIAGNDTNRYLNFSFVGNTFSAGGVNASAMEQLHIDIWTPDCTSFDVFILDGSAPEQKVTLTPTTSQWNSYDIDLAQYTSLTKSGIIEFKFERSGTGAKTIYLDNIYFWKLPAGTFTYYADADGDGYGSGAAVLSSATTAPQGFSVNNTDCNDSVATSNPGASEVLNGVDDDCDGLVDDGVLPTIPTTDAPTPIARNSWDVQSVYSSAYANFSNVNFFPNWGQSTTFSRYTPVNDETLKYSNLTFQGIDFSGAKNISAMTKLHIDVWTPDMSSFKVALIAGGENAVTLTPTLSGWNSYEIDLATQYAGRNLSAAIQLKLERTLWTPSDGNVNSLYVDNIYFYRAATTQPPTVGTFTVPAKVAGDANFDLTAPTSNSTGAFTYTSSNSGVATISGSTVTIVGVGSSTITATQAAAGSYAAISVTATLEVSLATAAATPPTRNSWDVKSLFSGAYTNVAGTQWRPNWGQATQYAQVDIVGNPTIKYSNLNYEGVQLASPLDVTSYTTLHIDVYGAGTTAVNFYVINQAGGAGSPLQQIEVNTPLTLLPGVWNSFDIALSSLTGLELNRVGQFMFTGSGTIYIDNLYFFRAATGSTYYADADGDGYGSGSAVVLEPSTAPTGYSVNNTDCDDADATMNASYSFYVDADNDTYGTGSLISVCAVNATTPPSGYSVNNTDLDDSNASITCPTVIVTDAVNPTICKLVNARATVSVVVLTSPGATFKWYTQAATLASTSTLWTALVNNANYSGVDTASLVITRTTTSVPANGTRYKLVITGSGQSGNATSAVVSLQEQIVLSKAAVISVVGTLSPLLTTCQGTSVNLSLAAGSVGNIQWQSSADGITYANVGDVRAQSALSANNLVMSFNTGALTQSTWFRVVASNGACSSVNSTAVKITVSAPVTTGSISGGGVTVCAPLATGIDASGNPLTAAITNSTTLTLSDYTVGATILWQKSTNLVNSTNTTPVWASAVSTTNTLTASALAVTTWYRAQVTNGACKDFTEPVKITVSLSAKVGVITSAASVCTGGNIRFTSAAYTGTSIQWEVSTTSATTGFVAVSGENGLVFDMNNVTYAPLSKFYVRSVVTSGNCTLARSTAKTITVNPLSVSGTVKGGGTVCSGSNGTLSVAGNTGTIQWQSSANGTDFVNVPSVVGTTGVNYASGSATGIAATYIATNITGDTHFRAKITSGACSVVYSNAVKFTIGTAASSGTLTSAAETVCSGSGTTLTLSNSVGSIQWLKATVSTLGVYGTWGAVTTSTTGTLATGNLTASTAYKAEVTIGSCSTLTSEVVSVLVNAAPLAKTITANTTTPTGASTALAICTSASFSKVLTIGANYIGAIQWQKSTTSATTEFADIANQTGTSYTVTNPVAGANYFRAKFTNACGVSVYSAAFTVNYKSCAAIKTNTSLETGKTPFAVVSYPNPFSNNFNLNVTTSSSENVEVNVYDVIGKLIDRLEVNQNAASELQIGNNYPSGIYNVIVTQGANVKMLRVIKK